MKNIVEQVIDEKDIQLLEKMAQKYNMNNIAEFGRFLGKKTISNGIRFQMRFSADELDYVDKMAAKNNLSRSKYCQSAYQWFAENEIYKKINLTDFKESEGEKTKRVSVFFDNGDYYSSLRKIANDLSIPFSALLRYCALNFKIN